MTFREKLISIGQYPLKTKGIRVLQVNLGYHCNMACKHCHVQGGPARQEKMDSETARAVLRVLGNYDIPVLDLTGGAPEMNPCFKDLVSVARKENRHVIVRTNLTVLSDKGYDDLPPFFRDNGVEIVASLPYYAAESVDRVRGAGVFDKSIAALQMLNRLGYGNGSDAVLNLVYNPQGAFLPAAQDSLEQDYRKRLFEGFGISFNNLFAFTNMPLGRFRDFLVKTGTLESYMARLRDAFNPSTLEHLMCRQLISVGWDGRLYCCDFNQAIGLPVSEWLPQHIQDADLAGLAEREISVGDHCYACTAGQGST